MDSLRAFIAIEIPAGIKKALALQTASLQAEAGRAVRWVATENIHLTLKFLGELSPTNVGLLSQAIQFECNQQAPFEISVSGLGSFPNLHRLQHRIELAAAGLGYSVEDKPFSAHLTIGRVREGVAPDEMKSLQAALSGAQAGEFGRFTARTVTLFKSELQPAGPLYTALFSAQFSQ